MAFAQDPNHIGHGHLAFPILLSIIFVNTATATVEVNDVASLSNASPLRRGGIGTIGLPSSVSVTTLASRRISTSLCATLVGKVKQRLSYTPYIYITASHGALRTVSCVHCC